MIPARQAAMQKSVGKTPRFQAGPYQGKYRGPGQANAFKSRQFGPGSNPNVGKGTALQGPGSASSRFPK